MDIVSLLILRALSGGGGGDIPVASQIDYDNSTSGLDAENVQNALDELSSEKINASEKGSAGGVAELNENGIIVTSQLPSYVDDVLEFPTLNDFPAQGESGKIYVDTSTNKTYRWGGSSYTEISPSLALGETSSTAYRGDRGKTAYDHSQLKTGNPHNVTKAQIGLGNVNNTSDANKPISTATQAALDTKTSVADVEEMIEETFEDKTVTGNPISFETIVGTEHVKSAKVTMLPIQSGRGDASPTNIRPISGRNSVSLTACGKNLFDISSENNAIRGLSIPQGTVLYGITTYTTTVVAYIGFADGTQTTWDLTTTKSSYTAAKNIVSLAFGTITWANIKSANKNVMVSLVDFDTLEPYNGQTYTATFPSTVYGGEYEFVEAPLKRTYGIVDLGTLNWVSEDSSLSGTARVEKTEVDTLGIKWESTPLCSQYKGVLHKSLNSFEYGEIGLSNVESYPLLRCRSEAFVGKTNAEIKTMLTGVQFCYELATPTTTTLTPQSISLNKGANVIATDGYNAEVKYSGDIGEYINIVLAQNDGTDISY